MCGICRFTAADSEDAVRMRACLNLCVREEMLDRL